MDLRTFTQQELIEVKKDLERMLFQGFDQPWGDITYKVLGKAYNEVVKELDFKKKKGDSFLFFKIAKVNPKYKDGLKGHKINEWLKRYLI